MRKERLMERGEWLCVQLVATVAVIVAALFVGRRVSENDDILRGHGAVVAARGSWSGDAARIVLGRDMERHDYGGLIVWGIAVVVIGLIWLVPLFVGALRRPPSSS